MIKKTQKKQQQINKIIQIHKSNRAIAMFSQLSFDEFDSFIGLEHASDHFVSNKSIRYVSVFLSYSENEQNYELKLENAYKNTC